MPNLSHPASDRLREELPDNCKDAAHWWYDFGFDVAPMDPQTKHTRLPWDVWLPRLEADGHKAIDQTFRDTDGLCAIVDDQVLVLDADTPESKAALFRLLDAFGIAANLIVRTKSGVHVYLRRESGTYAKMQGYNSSKHPDRIDIRTARSSDEGRSVIVLPPSPGKAIEINEADTLNDLVEVGQDFIDAVFRHNGQEPPRAPEPRQVAETRRKVGNTEAAEILSHIPPDCGYSDWLTVLMGVHDLHAGSDEGLYLLVQWSSAASNYCGSEELEYKYQSFVSGKAGAVTFNSVCKLAKDHGADPSAIAKGYDENGERLPTFEQAREAAEGLDRDATPADVDAVVVMVSRLSAIEKRQVFQIIKRNTGLPLTTLQQAISEKSTSEDVPPIEYAHKALEQYGKSNFVHAFDAYWRYPGRGVWIEEHAEAVKQKIHAVIPDDQISGSAVDDVLKLARTSAFDAGAKFGEPFEGVNVKNGLLVHDGKQWELQPHRKDLFLVAQSPVEYDPAADCPRFQQFLAEIFEGDPDADEKALLLLQLIGYTLLPLSRFEKFALLIGRGANGKSVFLEVLIALLGFDSVAGVAPEKLNDKFQRAYLHGKLANIVTEIEEGAVIADAALKAITSGELTTAEHKYRNPFSFKPVSTCRFATNHMPHTRDFSDALFRRACLLTFNNKFEGDRCDPHLKDRLLTELPGILNMALSAIGGVLAGGDFAEPASMMDARREWRLEADQVLQFVEECCNVGTGEIQKGTLYREYKDWAAEAGVQRTLAQKTFNNRLLMAGIGERRDRNARFYVGISLRIVNV